MPPRRGKEKASSRQPRVRLSRRDRQNVQGEMAVINTMQMVINFGTDVARTAFRQGYINEEEHNLQNRMYSLLHEMFDRMEFLVLSRAAGGGSGEQPGSSQASSEAAEAASGPSQESSDVPAEGAVAGSSRSTGRRRSGDPLNVPSEVPEKPTEGSPQGRSRSSSESEKSNPEPRRSNRLRKKSKDK